MCSFWVNLYKQLSAKDYLESAGYKSFGCWKIYDFCLQFTHSVWRAKREEAPLGQDMCLSHFHYAMSDRWKRHFWPVHHQFKRSKENPILGFSLLWAWVKEPLCFLELLAWHWLKTPLLCNTLNDIKCRYIVTTQFPPNLPSCTCLLRNEDAHRWLYH